MRRESRLPRASASGACDLERWTVELEPSLTFDCIDLLLLRRGQGLSRWVHFRIRKLVNPHAKRCRRAFLPRFSYRCDAP